MSFIAFRIFWKNEFLKKKQSFLTFLNYKICEMNFDSSVFHFKTLHFQIESQTKNNKVHLSLVFESTDNI